MMSSPHRTFLALGLLVTLCALLRQAEGSRRGTHVSSVTRKGVSLKQHDAALRRRLGSEELLLTAPPAPRPPPATLASNVTYRPNPLNDFKYYSQGWNPGNKDYWASLGWSVVYGAIIGVIWLLLGLGFLLFLVLLCIVCKSRWRSIKRREGRFTKRHVAWPATFAVLALIIGTTGFVMMIVGNQDYNNVIKDTTLEIKNGIQKLSDVLDSVSRLLTAVGNQSIVQSVVPENVRSELSAAATRANDTATRLLNKVTRGQSDINDFSDTITLLLFIIGCICFGVMLLGGIAAAINWGLATMILSSIIWVLCFFTWMLFAVFLMVYSLNSDTSVALVQVGMDPVEYTPLNYYIPCPEGQSVNVTQIFSRFAAKAAIVLTNEAVTKQAPFIFKKLNVTSVCDPFGPPPVFEYNPVTCPSRNITLQSLNQSLSSFACTSDDATVCQAAHLVPKALALGISAAFALEQKLVDTFPQLQGILECRAVQYLVNFATVQIGKMQNAVRLLWIGFMLLAVGGMLCATALPVLAFMRARMKGAGAANDTEEKGPLSDPATGVWESEEAYPEAEQPYAYQDEQYDVAESYSSGGSGAAGGAAAGYSAGAGDHSGAASSSSGGQRDEQPPSKLGGWSRPKAQEQQY